MPQSLGKLIVHGVFSTKGHYPFLSDEVVRRDTHAYLAGVLKRLDSPAITVGGTHDHVHLLFLLARTRTAAEIIKECKRVSSIWIKDNGGRLAKFHWQGGYAVFSVSQSLVANVKAYIDTQETHHSWMSFQDELKRLLAKHQVEYDERYVWD